MKRSTAANRPSRAGLAALAAAACLLTFGQAAAEDIDSTEYWREAWEKMLHRLRVLRPPAQRQERRPRSDQGRSGLGRSLGGHRVLLRHLGAADVVLPPSARGRSRALHKFLDLGSVSKFCLVRTHVAGGYGPRAASGPRQRQRRGPQGRRGDLPGCVLCGQTIRPPAVDATGTSEYTPPLAAVAPHTERNCTHGRQRG